MTWFGHGHRDEEPDDVVDETPHPRDKSDPLGILDIGLVCDGTSSMDKFLAFARELLVTASQEAADRFDARLKFGVVQYWDHPPEAPQLVRVYQLRDLPAAQEVLNRLTVDGGGDTPEAVLDGVKAACEQLHWREHGRRIVVLVGDAPPHGTVKHIGDKWPHGCPCGETLQSIAALVRESRVRLITVALTTEASGPFAELAELSGGKSIVLKHHRDAHSAITPIVEALALEFGDITLDRKVWRDVIERRMVDPEEISVREDYPVEDVRESLMRLRLRDLMA